MICFAPLHLQDSGQYSINIIQPWFQQQPQDMANDSAWTNMLSDPYI